MSEFTIRPRDFGRSWTIPTGQVTVFRLVPARGYLLEVEDLHFHHKSAVMLPDHGDLLAEPEPDHVAGLDVIRTAWLYAHEHPDRKLLVAGHTDRSGSTDTNFKLSRKRAADVLAVLKLDEDSWVKIAQDTGKVEDYQQILRWVAVTRGWDCDPVTIDDKHGDNTNTAVKNFQRTYNETHGTSIKVNGKVGEKTWRAFFSLYLETLAQDLNTDIDGLGVYRDGLHFLDPARPTVGCGESHPISDDRKENYRNPVDRRVELLFFEPGEEPPLDCHPTETKCQPEKCVLYRGNHYTYHPIPPEGHDVHTIQIMAIESIVFAAGAETIRLDWQISGPLDEVVALKLVAAPVKQPEKRLVEKLLAGPYAQTGSVEWEGDITDPAFAGFLTVKSSPYRVWLELQNTAGQTHASNSYDVSVELASVELFTDDPLMAKIPLAHQESVKRLKEQIASRAEHPRLMLDFPVFEVDYPDENHDDTSFEQYRDHAKHGVEVPIFLRAFVKSKTESQVRSPRALSGLRILWNLSYRDDQVFAALLDSDQVHPQARGVALKATSYKMNESQPPGRAAHLDQGGLRGREKDRKPEQKRWRKLDGTWGLEAPAKRVWCAYTRCGNVEGVQADSGLKFLSGRIARDTHFIQALVDLDGSLDDADDAKLVPIPKARRSKRFEFRNWREIKARTIYLIGKPTVPSEYTDFNEQLNQAGLSLTLPPPESHIEMSSGWRKWYQATIAEMGQSDTFVAAACMPDPGGWPVAYYPFEEYQKRAKAQASGPFIFFSLITHPTTYRKKCSSKAHEIRDRIAARFAPLLEGGLTFFIFGKKGHHNLSPDEWGGMASPIQGLTDRHKAIFYIFGEGSGSNTFVHELGHTLFLAHAPGDAPPDKDKPSDVDDDSHVLESIESCIMSYVGGARHLCGLCHLKLAGWRPSSIKRDGTVEP